MTNPVSERDQMRLDIQAPAVREAMERVYARPTLENIETLVYVAQSQGLVDMVKRLTK